LTLRHDLKSSTADLHSRLDARLGALDLADRADYARFLRIQLAARGPIERWCGAHLPAALLPPAQSALTAADLAALGVIGGAAAMPFAAPPMCAGTALGVAWALGGSSLGNRAMLAHLRRTASGDWPTAFLADPAMPAFWSALRPHLERSANAEETRAAVAGAEAVFAQFLAAADRAPLRAAA
jgi:heme oxygenase